MNWLSYVYVSGMTSAFIASLIYIYLYIKSRKPYMRIFSIGWGIFFVQRVLGLFSKLNSIKIFDSLRTILYLIALCLFVFGIYYVIEQRVRKWMVFILGISTIFMCVAIAIDSPSIIQNIPMAFVGIVLLKSSIDIIRTKKVQRQGKYIVGWTFFVWSLYYIIYGIHDIICILFGPLEGLVSIGYFVYSVIINVLAIGILIIYFEKILERLEKSEERYKLLVELCPDAIGVAVDDKLAFVNTAALKLIKAENKEQVIGQAVEKFIHSDHIKLVKKNFKKLFDTGAFQSLNEVKIQALDGTVVEVETAATLFPYNNRIAICGTVRDITERKRAERLKKHIEEKTRLLKEAQELENLRNEFFANISHELRTPLNIILGSIQLFEMYNENDCEKTNLNDKKHIKVIKQNCNRLLKLVNNLIDITKIDAGFYKTNFQNCNIVNIVEDITLSVVDYVENKDISLIFDTDIEEKIIACDPDKIERIILNLLSNAIKFTGRQGNILVSVNDDIDNINIIVKDDGVGIPKEKQQIIFERFKQVENTLSRSNEGSGIGLSLVKSLVEMHHGTIAVESEYGKGTEFTIKLPVRTVPEENTIEKSNFSINQSLIERISIEFSDIYGA